MTIEEIIIACLARSSFRKLARDARCSPQSIVSWRDGVTEPKISHLDRLCKAVGLTLYADGVPIDEYQFTCVPSGGTSQGRACRRLLNGYGRVSDLVEVTGCEVSCG